MLAGSGSDTLVHTAEVPSSDTHSSWCSVAWTVHAVPRAPLLGSFVKAPETGINVTGFVLTGIRPRCGLVLCS